MKLQDKEDDKHKLETSVELVVCCQGRFFSNVVEQQALVASRKALLTAQCQIGCCYVGKRCDTCWQLILTLYEVIGRHGRQTLKSERKGTV